MKSRQSVMVGLLVVLGLSVMVCSAGASPLVSDDNLLLNKSVTVSSNWADNASSGTFGYAVNATNGAGGGPNGDFLFAQGDNTQRMVITGFDGTISLIRIWSGSDLFPGQVAVKSSATANLGLDGTFEATLGSWSYSDSISTWTDSGATDLDDMELYYKDIVLATPTSAKSLYLDFGDARTSGPNPDFNSSRISEVQAFAVPEPSTIVLLAVGALSLLAYAWRKNR